MHTFTLKVKYSRMYIYIQVTVWPQHVPAARAICQEGFTIPDVGRQESMLTFESNIVFVMRYMVDAKLVGEALFHLTMSEHLWVRASFIILMNLWVRASFIILCLSKISQFSK